MTRPVKQIPLDKIHPHPDNPNRMSKTIFDKLVRNITRTGLYEPLIVRPHPILPDCYQLINGHNRLKALKKLNHTHADCIIWPLDDNETNLALINLNRLCGHDQLDKKLQLLEKLSQNKTLDQLAKLLPQTKKQLQKLANLKSTLSDLPKIDTSLAQPVVFFLYPEDKKLLDTALKSVTIDDTNLTSAARRSSALITIAKFYLENSITPQHF